MRNVLAATQQMASEYSAGSEDGESDHLFCLLDYLTGYPDKVHHPTEEAVFDRLRNMDLTAEESDKLRRNQSQHSELQSATEQLAVRFDLLRDEVDVSELLDTLDEYSKKQLEHMAFEERETFPLAAEKIPQSVWKELDQQFGESRDPLFDQADKSYAALYQYLVSDPAVPEDASMSDALLRFLNATVIGGT